MAKLKKVELLHEAINLLGPLGEDEKSAVSFLLTMLGDVSVDHRPSYRETMKAIADIEQAAKFIESRLRNLDQLVLEGLPAVKKLARITLSSETLITDIDELLPEVLARRALGPTRLTAMDAVQTIASRARDAQKELRPYGVKGGPSTFRAKLSRSGKELFVQNCSNVWFLCAKRGDRRIKKNMLVFVHLVYEAITGEEEGRGLRDLIAKSHRRTLEHYSNKTSIENKMRVLAYNRALGQGLVADAANAEWTLLLGWIDRNIQMSDTRSANP